MGPRTGRDRLRAAGLEIVKPHRRGAPRLPNDQDIHPCPWRRNADAGRELQVHNAMNGLMWRELLENAARTLDADDKVRAVILTGDGQTFCAGGDLGYQQAQEKATGGRASRRSPALLRTAPRPRFPSKPLVGRINGAAYAGGFSLISVTDIAIGVDTAKFAITEARLGLVPAITPPFYLPSARRRQRAPPLPDGPAFLRRGGRHIRLASCVSGG